MSIDRPPQVDIISQIEQLYNFFPFRLEPLHFESYFNAKTLLRTKTGSTVNSENLNQDCLFNTPFFHEHLKRNDISAFFQKFTYVVGLIRLRRITKSPTMLHEDCLVLLPLVAQAKDNIPKNATRISDALNCEVAILMGVSIISCNMMNSI